MRERVARVIAVRRAAAVHVHGELSLRRTAAAAAGVVVTAIATLPLFCVIS